MNANNPEAPNVVVTTSKESDKINHKCLVIGGNWHCIPTDQFLDFSKHYWLKARAVKVESTGYGVLSFQHSSRSTHQQFSEIINSIPLKEGYTQYNSIAINNSGKFYHDILDEGIIDYKSIEVFPLSEGGININFKFEDKIILAEFFNDGEIVLLTKEGNLDSIAYDFDSYQNFETKYYEMIENGAEEMS